jgi:hypothetical protein
MCLHPDPVPNSSSMSGSSCGRLDLRSGEQWWYHGRKAVRQWAVKAQWKTIFLMRTIKEEEVTLHDDSDFHAAYQHLGRFLDDVYQQKRLYAALGYLTPAEFETQWLQQPIAVPVRLEAPSNGPTCWGHYSRWGVGSNQHWHFFGLKRTDNVIAAA